jgi:hypothetical protein
MIEKTCSEDGVLVAIVIRQSYRRDGISFFTPAEFSQQLGYMNRPAGHLVEPHVHREVHREITLTQEVLFVKSGRIRVDLFDTACKHVESKELTEGDIILLASGGHGIEMLEQTEIIEVKQGPFSSEEDKVRF